MSTALLDRDPAEIAALRAAASPEQREVIDRGLDAVTRSWEYLRRTAQTPPEGDWLIWLLVTGRRWGKTRTAAEWLRHRCLATVGAYAICAPTYADARDVCVEQGTREAPSGFLSVCRPSEIDTYNRSLGEIRMVNGSKIKMLSADEPERARGWGFHAAWCDEFSSWRRPATWYETLLPAVSMADRHRFVITTTPKRNDLTRMILHRAHDDPAAVRLVRGHTFENADNLGAGVVEELRSAMTPRVARQELDGELLDDVEGALFRRDWLLRLDADFVPAADDTIVVAIDPAVTSGEGSDETGIIVAGRYAGSKHGYVLEDLSGRHSPEEAMRIAVEAYRHQDAAEVVIERNNGGDYLPALLRTIDPTVRHRTVHASQGKQTRAQPATAMYANGRVFHVGDFPELEDQMTSWVLGDRSPDRVDALVWALTALFPEDWRDVRRLHYRGR